MRLVDADELMEHVYRDKLDSRELIAKMIQNAPTIEPKKGRWQEFHIGKCPLVECTSCHMARDVREVPHTNGGKVAWKFCPDCGADMREGAK